MVTITSKQSYYDPVFTKNPVGLRHHVEMKKKANKSFRMNWKPFFDGKSLREHAGNLLQQDHEEYDVYRSCVKTVKLGMGVLQLDIDIMDKIKTGVGAAHSEMLLHRKIEVGL